MRKPKKRCPICAEKMTFENNQFACRHCGYSINENHTSGSIRFDYESNHQPAAPSSNKAAGNRHDKLKPIKIIFTVYGVASVLYGAFLQFKASRNPVNTPTLNVTIAESVSAMAESLSFSDVPAAPQSEMFILFTEQVFQKKLSEISAEELSAITSLHLYHDENNTQTISYALKNGSLGEVCFFDHPNYTYSDLSCFTGLTSLNIEDSTLLVQKGDFDGLVNLTELWSDLSPSELLSLLPEPQKLEILGVYDNFFVTSLDGIEQFENLTHLSVDRCRLKNLDALCGLPNLTELELTDADYMENFAALYQLKQLERISIESSALRDIGFVENMPNLTSLSIKDAKLLQIDALAFCADSLAYLSLWHTYEVEDYSVLDLLDKLVYLEIEPPYEYSLPSFSHMEGLTELRLGRVRDISSVSTASHLKNLKLDGCSGETLSALSGLAELENLEISNISGYFITLHPLLELTGLERLALDDCRIYADIEEVLTLPNLQEFSMTDCRVGFDFDKLTRNESLKVLHLDNSMFAEILPREDAAYGNMNSDNERNLSDYSDVLALFPNITELSLVGNKLDNVRFAAELTHLQVLNIADNYVTDLRPLAGLAELKTVICTDNPLGYTDGVEDKMIQ